MPCFLAARTAARRGLGALLGQGRRRCRRCAASGRRPRRRAGRSRPRRDAAGRSRCGPRSETPLAPRTPNPRSVKFSPLRTVRPTPSDSAQLTQRGVHAAGEDEALDQVPDLVVDQRADHRRAAGRTRGTGRGSRCTRRRPPRRRRCGPYGSAGRRDPAAASPRRARRPGSGRLPPDGVRAGRTCQRSPFQDAATATAWAQSRWIVAASPASITSAGNHPGAADGGDVGQGQVVGQGCRPTPRRWE